VPIWKTTYEPHRAAFPSGKRPLLQGWAIVDNTWGRIGQRGTLAGGLSGAALFYSTTPRTPFYEASGLPLPESVQLSLSRKTLPQRRLIRGNGRLNGRSQTNRAQRLLGANVSASGWKIPSERADHHREQRHTLSKAFLLRETTRANVERQGFPEECYFLTHCPRRARNQVQHAIAPGVEHRNCRVQKQYIATVKHIYKHRIAGTRNSGSVANRAHVGVGSGAVFGMGDETGLNRRETCSSLPLLAPGCFARRST